MAGHCCRAEGVTAAAGEAGATKPQSGEGAAEWAPFMRGRGELWWGVRGEGGVLLLQLEKQPPPNL